MYINEDLRTKRLHNYEDDDFSQICVETGLPHKQKIIVGGVYREFDHLKTHLDREKHSSHNKQEVRWRRFLAQWERILDLKREVIVVGDFNIDVSNDTNRSYLQEILFKAYQETVLLRGIVQLVKSPTRYQGNNNRHCQIMSTPPIQNIWGLKI